MSNRVSFLHRQQNRKGNPAKFCFVLEKMDSPYSPIILYKKHRKPNLEKNQHFKAKPGNQEFECALLNKTGCFLIAFADVIFSAIYIILIDNIML